MGLFDTFKKKRPQQTTQPLPEEIELKESVRKKDSFFDERNKIEKQYKETRDIENYIKSYRNILEDPEVLQYAGSWIFKYPETLVKEKRYNEAWGALNQIIPYRPDDFGKISYMFYEILKKEDKHPMDAMFHLMVSYLLRPKGATDPYNTYMEEKGSFLKKAKPLAKKSGFTEQEIEYLSYLIESQVKSNRYSVKTLQTNYYLFLKERKYG